MPIAIMSVILQVLAVVHVVRTGRDMRWIFLILFVPGIGALVYFAVEVLPSLNQSVTARRAMRRVRNTVDPSRGVRNTRLAFERNQTVDTASALADALSKASQFDEAISVCNQVRSGMFQDDPKLLLSLASAQFGAARYTDAIATLDHAREKNPDFKSADGHLLYARALEETGATERALEEYEALGRYYPGAEARVRQALLHKKLGTSAKAEELFASILKDARLAPPHFRRSQREWIDIAQRNSSK